MARQPLKIKKLVLNVLLAAMLVAAQAAVASHYDGDSHAVDATCAICVSSSTLGAGDVSRIELFVPAIQVAAQIREVFVCILVEFACSQSARAPPVLS